MRAFRRRPRRDPQPWSRRKLLVSATAITAAGVLLLVGLGASVYYALHPTHTAHTAGAATATWSPTAPTSLPAAVGGGSVVPLPASTSAGPGGHGTPALEDALAARAMPSATLAQAQPGAPISSTDPGSIAVPTTARTDPLGVGAVYPHTPQGALAAMASIDKTAFDSGSMAGVRAVITAWAAPGGPTTSSWSGVKAMASFFDAAGLSGSGAAQLSIVMTPVMGLVKGTVGADFVVPCVDFEMDATLAQTERVGVADCERMVWTGDRWMVGAGAEPATPPSVWPDTDDAIRFGYHDLVTR